ncbi:MAG TPA: O-antigen ligase family protein, partial [Candidatus Polarisedimenticolaceae bacterium]|nr:O-antigen ligase family protein [Candidatus Polarisedimenticolaceae bacterium]
RTGAALVALAIVAATVAATRGASRLALALALSAAFQALYGILVLASDQPTIWGRAKHVFLNAATGSFVNPNHFACFLSIGLACGTALALGELPGDEAEGARTGWTEWFGRRGSRGLALLLLLALILAGLLVSFSRAGLALGMGCAALVLLAGGGRTAWRTRLLGAAVVALAALVPLFDLGIAHLIERYASTKQEFILPGGRVRVWQDTLAMSAAFPVAGSGFGTFAAVYPLYRSTEVRHFYQHAHNDLLQTAAEGGTAGALLALLVLAAILRSSRAALAGRSGTVGVGLACGLIAFLFHGLIDFNLHIPANAAAAAILAGALEGLAWKPS